MRRPARPVDVVAVILALGLAGAVLGILLATTVQIVKGNPEVALSDNATQVLVGATGALTGLLGGYMGSRRPPPPAHRLGGRPMTRPLFSLSVRRRLAGVVRVRSPRRWDAHRHRLRACRPVCAILASNDGEVDLCRL